MEINKKLLTRNYRKGRTESIKYIVIHYTAGLTSKAGSNLGTVNGWQNSDKAASAHYVVDDGGIVQAVEDKDTAWHCGTTGTYYHKYCRNSNSIGIEICSNLKGGIPEGKKYNDILASDSNWYLTESAKDYAAKLTAELCKKYNLCPEDAVLRHYDVTHKDCPSPLVDDNKEGFIGWLKFKLKVLDYYNGGIERYNDLEDLPKWAVEDIKWLIDNDYLKGGKNGLDLSYDMVRMCVLMSRLHKGV